MRGYIGWTLERKKIDEQIEVAGGGGAMDVLGEGGGGDGGGGGRGGGHEGRMKKERWPW